MKISTIALEWFRGAAERAVLNTRNQSLVVYGANGSGKSSFVDAIEYLLNKGKIRHLSNEYTGRYQEKAIPNTHKPEGATTTVRAKFEDNSELESAFSESGQFNRIGTAAALINGWDFRRMILRQDEVSEFIHETKGNKYSALLPLLGLEQLEFAAENLRQLVKSIEIESNLAERNTACRRVGEMKGRVFPDQSDDQIRQAIENLHLKYCPDNTATNGTNARCAELDAAIQIRMTESSLEHNRHFALQALTNFDLPTAAANVRAKNLLVAQTLEPLLDEKVEVLLKVISFVEKLESETEIACPACGRSIQAAELRLHVTEEHARLEAVVSAMEQRKQAIACLCDGLTTLRTQLGSPHLNNWRDQLASDELLAGLATAESLDLRALRSSCTEQNLLELEVNVSLLIANAASAAKNAPPDAKELSSAKRIVETTKAILDAKNEVAEIQRVNVLLGFARVSEQEVRNEIRRQSQTAIDKISADIQSMWKTLHPDAEIEHVNLYLAEGTDKAIDIRLKFYGVDQDSPRLTLSEGYRNSLGLCIFLAVAKQDNSRDWPLILDDVVISLDRDHRGMIQQLLERHFPDRQVIVLTHDRGWYSELRQQLDSTMWEFRVLLPWENPVTGIRWSEKTTTFGDARAGMTSRPDSAGNDARKVMDLELSLINERLELRLQYRRGDKNDKRMAHEFLERLIADGRKSFRKQSKGVYEVYAGAITAWETADKLLVSWGNRASHTFDVVRSEAEMLIDSCEQALEFTRCPSCHKNVWFAQSPNAFQCACGQIQWRR